MRILITNDDGIFAPGIKALYKRFSKKHDVMVVAPDRERSAVSHGISINHPLRAEWMDTDNGYRGYAVSGTPADCVKLALFELLEKKPDMVISGINMGANVGVNINYSGTIAAAREAALYGILSIAVSIHAGEITDYEGAACFTESLAEMLFKEGLSFGTLLNVNIPALNLKDAAGVRFSKQSISHFSESFEKRTDPRNRSYYWIGCDTQPVDKHSDADTAVLCQNHISITPIRCDMTDYESLEKLKNWSF